MFFFRKRESRESRIGKEEKTDARYPIDELEKLVMKTPLEVHYLIQGQHRVLNGYVVDVLKENNGFNFGKGRMSFSLVWWDKKDFQGMRSGVQLIRYADGKEFYRNDELLNYTGK
jgi:hypothetical protein